MYVLFESICFYIAHPLFHFEHFCSLHPHFPMKSVLSKVITTHRNPLSPDTHSHQSWVCELAAFDDDHYSVSFISWLLIFLFVQKNRASIGLAGRDTLLFNDIFFSCCHSLTFIFWRTNFFPLCLILKWPTKWYSLDFLPTPTFPIPFVVFPTSYLRYLITHFKYAFYTLLNTKSSNSSHPHKPVMPFPVKLQCIWCDYAILCHHRESLVLPL